LTSATRSWALGLPEGWTTLDSRGLARFVTKEVVRRPDGTVVVWESRPRRKHRAHGRSSTWWAPSSIGWWIGVLFAIGSLAFAVGAFPAYAVAAGTGYDNLTFFVGSIFFTSAAFLQYCEVVSTPRRRSETRLRLYQPDRIDWWATAVQLLGTLFFNLSTGRALLTGLAGPTNVNHNVWRPDALGSVCFLVASFLAWAEVCHRAWAWQPRLISWWIGSLNLVGSVAFGVSAVASKVQPNGQLRSVALTNLGTFVGALCFLVGGLLLLPERTNTPPTELDTD
jgi:hypothetical protein